MATYQTFDIRLMKVSELIEALYSSSEEEVLIKSEDGLLDEIEIEHIEEQFDGFDTVYPATIALKAKKTER